MLVVVVSACQDNVSFNPVRSGSPESSTARTRPSLQRALVRRSPHPWDFPSANTFPAFNLRTGVGVGCRDHDFHPVPLGDLTLGGSADSLADERDLHASMFRTQPSYFMCDDLQVHRTVSHQRHFRLARISIRNGTFIDDRNGESGRLFQRYSD